MKPIAFDLAQCLVLAALIGWTALAERGRDCRANEIDDTVQIAVHWRADVPNEIVRVAHVAEVDGGDEALREQISKLDLSDPPSADQPLVVTRTQIEMRLLLAGISPRDVQLTGASRATLELQEQQLTDEAVLHALRPMLAKRFNVEEDDLDVRLAVPLPRQATLPINAADVQLEPLLPARVQRQAGQMRVNLAIHVNGNLVRVVPASIDVRIFRKVAQATTRIERGQTLTKDNVEIQRVPLSGYLLDSSASPDVFGTTARRQLSPGEIIKATVVESPALQSEPYVVGPRDLVRLVARKSSLKVIVASAEVLERGRLGDFVRVRNVQSQRIVVGRLVGPTEVEVEL